MAMSSCPKCGNTSFEIRENTPLGSNYKFFFIQCSECGSVVGVMEYININSMLLKQNEALRQIANALNITVDLD